MEEIFTGIVGVQDIEERLRDNTLDRSERLLERLIEYSRTDQYPFHMPGHKRQEKGTSLERFPNPYTIDITEIDGFDNLHHPEGILKKSMDQAAQIYGAARTYYLINGSTGGILSAISAAVSRGGRILLSRNCHTSAYHGALLNGLRAAYIYPQFIWNLGINGGVCPSDVEKALEDFPDAEAVLIVSPTYDGIVSDVKGIAEVVHRKKIPLIVDEAHGAHFPFWKASSERMMSGEEKTGFPPSALDCGADLVIQSLHKTLPSFTQTAVLHVGKDCRGVEIERLERYLRIYQSSSPSYVLMAGIEQCIFEMEEKGAGWLNDFSERLEDVREKLGRMRHLCLLDEKEIGRNGVYGIDRSKVVISCKNCYWERDSQSQEKSGNNEGFLNGRELAECLRRDHHLEMEMCGADYVVAITTFMDTPEGLHRLTRAFLEMDGKLAGGKACSGEHESTGGGKWLGEDDGSQKEKDETWRKPVVCLSLADAVEAPWESVPLGLSAGRISGEFIYLYPPGIPAVVPGEKITEELLRQILQYKELGLPVQGPADGKAEYLRVCR